MTRKKQMLLGGLIVIIILGFVGFSIFKIAFNKDKQLDNLYEAVYSEDVKYLKQHLHVKGKTNLTDQDIHKVIDLLLDIGIENVYVADDRESSEDNIYISKEGKEKLIYDNFVVNMESVDLKLHSSINGAEVFLDGKSLGETDENYEFYHEDLIPGTYKIKVTYDGEHGKDQKTEEVYLYDNEEDIIVTEFNLDIQDAETKEINIRKKLDELIYNYEVGLVDAINANNFSLASPYIEVGSQLYKMQADLVVHLNKKGVSEDYIYHELKDVTKIDDNTYEMIVTESHVLYYENRTQETTNNTWRYGAKKVGEKFMLTSLNSLK